MNFSNIKDWTIPEGTVKQVTDSLGRVIWEGVHDYSQDYFYVEDVSGSDITLSIRKNGNKAPTINVFKSTDGTNWTSMGNTSTTAITATIPANGRLYLKATANGWYRSYYNYMIVSGNHNVGGNIMSLLYGDNFQGQTTFPSGSSLNFHSIFYNNAKLVSAANLALPATTLVEGCYQNMFLNCTSLTQAPALSATTLAQDCYQNMFRNCTSLTQAPALSATTLASRCYNYMFNGCTSLTQAPTLPATTLASRCYQYMFSGCKALTQAPALPATTLVEGCYDDMFYNCTSLTTAPTLPATTLARYCYHYMFRNCTALTQAPTLPATTLAEYCYRYMFQDCTNLNSITTYAADISATDCLNNWLQNVAATGTFYNLGSATYPSGDSGIPTGWTEVNS